MRPYDQRVIAPMARPSTEDLNSARSADAYRLGFLAQQLFARNVSATDPSVSFPTGFLATGFQVVPATPATLSVDLLPGLGFYYDATAPLVIATDSFGQAYQGVIDLAPYRPLVVDTRISIPIALPLPGAGDWRYDVIEVKPKRLMQDYSSILRWDMGASNWAPSTVATFLRYAIEQGDLGYSAGNTAGPSAATSTLSYLIGPASAGPGAPLEPQTTPGYVKVGRILVQNGAANIGADVIQDARRLLFPGGVETVSCRISLAGTMGGAIPTVLQSVTPSNVRIVPRRYDTKVMLVDVFAGGSLTAVTAVANLLITALPPPGTEIQVPQITAPVIAFVTTAEKALLADPAYTNPVVQVAQGQVMAQFFMTGVRQAGNATSQAIDDPAIYSLQIGIRT